jgi:hypothetical protein
MVQRSIVLLLLLLAIGCRDKPSAHTLSTPTPGNGLAPNPVFLCDSTKNTCNLLGDVNNPIYTQGTGGGGASAVTVSNDAGNPLPTDTVPGDSLNSVADTTSAAVQGQVKASAGTFVSVNACNEGTVTGWLMFYDQGGAGPDAGAVTGTSGKFLGIRTPAGACTFLGGVRSFSNGIMWYSSGQASTLDAGLAPSFTVETFYR